VLHCEHSPCYSRRQAYHLLTDGRWKYIWHPHEGHQRLFDLVEDPGEKVNLIDSAAVQASEWRERMVERLADRPEGFVRDGQLVAGREYPMLLPHAKTS